MSEWKVSVEQIELFEHPNAEKMSIGKVGTYQVCVQKGLYKSGDLVGFAPEKSVLPQGFKEPWEKYLAGTNHDRVKAVRLRQEWSTGIIIPLTTIVEKLGFTPKIGVDISEGLSIRKYEAPIPVSLMGQVQRFPEEIANEVAGAHDCEHFRTYASEFIIGEQVIVTEKVHGSQFICTSDAQGQNVTITSKGLRKDGLCLKEDENNNYWQAFRNDGIKTVINDVVATFQPKTVVRLFGELIPCQKGYSYGQSKPTVRLFDIRVDGVSIMLHKLPGSALNLWVPIIYRGGFDEAVILPMCEGNEQVSGKEFHIREGVVANPVIDRKAFDGTRLRLKIINPKYKDDDESFN
jgi:RNA ligase (TIGR02306 family)